MKTKSYKLEEKVADNGKIFEFVNLYKSAAETNLKLIDDKSAVKLNEGKNNSNRGSSSYKNKKKNKNNSVEIISNHSQDSRKASEPSSIENSKMTSIPNDREKKKGGNVKPIIKHSEGPPNLSNIKISNTKPKKRNKSVSFMLDDNEEVAVKKTKSNHAPNVHQNTVQSKIILNEKKKHMKLKSNLAEKENKGNTITTTQLDISDAITVKTNNLEKSKQKTESKESHPDTDSSNSHYKKKANKKLKKLLKEKEPVGSELEDEESVTQHENKSKKSKKNKHHLIPAQNIDSTDGEPVIKSRKKDIKAEIIAEDLENLNIGDNTHTLTNLLDEMTVVNKKKQKNNKGQLKKGKHPKIKEVSPSSTGNLEVGEEVKEKEKWMKRKWNKDKKGVLNIEQVSHSVVVERLPLNIMLSYKKLLTEHFSKCGVVKKVGIAEVYPTEDPKPVFTTTIYFDSEDAASKALEEDNTSFEGNYIRVKRPLPPTQTTLVVRTYGELSEQALSSVFSSAGRIRNIRHLVKGKKSMATAFIEFDGPSTVERAIKMAEEARIGGKKIHVSKYQMRKPKNNKKIKRITDKEDVEEDSDESSN